MKTTCRINGNLALKPVQFKPELSLVQEAKQGGISLYDSFVDQMFGFLQQRGKSSQVISVLEGSQRISFLANVKERRFALAASSIATIAMFYFSFFAF